MPRDTLHGEGLRGSPTGAYVGASGDSGAAVSGAATSGAMREALGSPTQQASIVLHARVGLRHHLGVVANRVLLCCVLSSSSASSASVPFSLSSHALLSSLAVHTHAVRSARPTAPCPPSAPPSRRAGPPADRAPSRAPRATPPAPPPAPPRRRAAPPPSPPHRYRRPYHAACRRPLRPRREPPSSRRTAAEPPKRSLPSP